MFFLLLLLFSTSLAWCTERLPELKTAAGQDISTIKRAYTNPGAADYIIGIKLLEGYGVPANPSTAFKQFLKAGIYQLLLEGSKKYIAQILDKQQISPENLQKILINDNAVNNLLEEIKKRNHNAFEILDLLRQKLPPVLAKQVLEAVTDLFNNTPNLTLNFTKVLIDTDVNKMIAILKNLEENYKIPYASFYLGTIYDMGLFVYDASVNVPKDYKTALNHYKIAANSNMMQAEFALGKAYVFNLGIEKDTQKGIELLQKTVEKNYTPAMLVLGSIYFYGLTPDIPADRARAIEYYQRAADLGDPVAIDYLGQLAFRGFNKAGIKEEPDYEKALQYFETAASKGYINSNYFLAFFYKAGINVPKDRKRAEELYKTIIDSGYAQTFAFKGEMYEYGIGVEQNLNNALYFYQETMRHGSFFYKKNVERVRRKIEQAAQLQPETPAEQFEIPAVKKVQKKAPARPSKEDIEYAKRKLDEDNFLHKLNDRYKAKCDDQSQVTEVNFEDGFIRVFRDSDKTEAIVTIDTEDQKRFKYVRKFVYQKRVQEWFDELNNKDLTGSAYNSMIRHTFPKMVDYISQLFGEKMVDNSETTLAIEGTLIPGKYPNNPITGHFVYGYNDKKREFDLYHRFLHLEKPRALA